MKRKAPVRDVRLIAKVEPLETRRLLSGAFPTAFEQYVLELINRARANPGAEVTRLSGSTWGDDPSVVPGTAYPQPQTPSLNEGLPAGTIADTAEPPLAFNADLTATAQQYSSTLLTNNSPLTHTYNGTSPTSRVQANGYSGEAGENLAVIANSAALPISESNAEQLHDNLFIDNNVTGRGHRLNILNTTSGYQEIGIGLAASTNYTALGSQTPNALMLTEDFGIPTNTNPILTGVAYADANNNHFYDPGEGLGNVTITATRTSDNAVFTTTTWDAGGYSLQLAPGTYSVAASGGGVGNPAPTVVTLTSQNVEVDFTPSTIVPVAPMVTTQPSSQTIAGGSSVTFTAAASGTPAPTVQWQVSTSGGAFTNIPGATSTTLSFTANASENGNQYQAVFTNSAGPATTDPATLTVTGLNGGPLLTSTLSGNLPSTALSGAKTTAKQTLIITNNSGAAISQPATVQLFISPDQTLDSNAVAVGNPIKEQLRLKTGGRKALPLALKAFPAVASGNYYVLAQLSTGGVASVAASSNTTAIVPPQIDLSGAFSKQPVTGKTGKTKLTFTVHNAGNVAAAGALAFNIDSSPDGLLDDATEITQASKSVHIAAGKFSTITVSETLPAGSYFVLIDLDPADVFNDVNLANNAFATADPITVA
jgi:uncharacterized protein YkwD